MNPNRSPKLLSIARFFAFVDLVSEHSNSQSSPLAPRALRGEKHGTARPEFLVAFIFFGLFSALAPSVGAETTWHSAEILEPGPYDVGSMDVDLVDSARPTAPNGSYEGASSRTLETTIWYPASGRSVECLRWSPTPVANTKNPFPLVIYSHGFMSFRSECKYLAEHLASHGYIVVAANFPLTNFFGPGKPNIADISNQPGDVSFLIDALLKWNQEPGHLLEGAVDPERIAAVGLSLGGMTTQLVAFHRKLRDPRVKAAVSIAGPTSIFTRTFFESTDIPFMAIFGDIDAIITHKTHALPLIEKAPRIALLTIKGASHTGFADIASLIFRWHRNPDSVGCGQLDDHLPKSEGFLDPLGGKEMGIAVTDMTMPCEFETLPRATRPTRQHEVVILGVYSFLEGQFALESSERDAAHLFLTKTMAEENDDAVYTPPRSGE